MHCVYCVASVTGPETTAVPVKRLVRRRHMANGCVCISLSVSVTQEPSSMVIVVVSVSVCVCIVVKTGPKGDKQVDNCFNSFQWGL